MYNIYIYILYQCVWFIQSNVFVWPGLVVWGQNGPGEDGWTRGTIDRRSHPEMENFWNMFGKWLVVATKATSWFARFGVFLELGPDFEQTNPMEVVCSWWLLKTTGVQPSIGLQLATLAHRILSVTTKTDEWTMTTECCLIQTVMTRYPLVI